MCVIIKTSTPPFFKFGSIPLVNANTRSLAPLLNYRIMSFTKKKDSLGNDVMVGIATLKSPLSKEFKSYTNGEGEEKNYKLATVAIETPSGKTTTLTVNVAEANIDRMEESGGEFTIGEGYLTTLQRVEKRDGSGMMTLGRMSHLQGAVADESVLDELFGEEESVSTEANSEVEAEA